MRVYVSLPLSGPARPRRQRRRRRCEARPGAGRRPRRGPRGAGRATSTTPSARRFWDPVAVGRERAHGRAGLQRRRLHRRARLRAHARLDADHQRCRHRPGLARRRRRRPDPPGRGLSGLPRALPPLGRGHLRAGGARRRQGAGRRRRVGGGAGECASVSVQLGDSPFGRLSAQEFERTRTRSGVEPRPGRCGRGDAGRQRAGVRAADAGARRVCSRRRLRPSGFPGLRGAGSPVNSRQRFGREPGPYAAYGYEAMQLVLAAIAEAEGEEEFRRAVADAGAGGGATEVGARRLLDHPRGRHHPLPHTAVRGPRRRPDRGRADLPRRLDLGAVEH